MNDASFHEQFYERRKFEDALLVFLGVLNILQAVKADYEFYREPHLPFRAFRGEVLIASINRVSEKSLIQLLFDVLNRIQAANWREHPVHSANDTFTCGDLDVGDTSLAELSERKLRNRDLVSTLINFPASRYTTKLELDVIKNDSDTLRLSCAENRSELAAWLKEVLNLSSTDYDYNSTRPPDDCETVLRDITRFHKTGQLQQGRRVHLEIHTRHYWYVDHLHYGQASHLEVFDARGLHIGEANLEGVLDPGKRDREKTIDVS